MLYEENVVGTSDQTIRRILVFPCWFANIILFIRFKQHTLSEYERKKSHIAPIKSSQQSTNSYKPLSNAARDKNGGT